MSDRPKERHPSRHLRVKLLFRTARLLRVPIDIRPAYFKALKK